MMNRSMLDNCVRGVIAAAIVGSTTTLGLSAATAAPTPSAPTVQVAGSCSSYWPSPYQVCDEIRDLYTSLGGPSGSLSFPKAAQVTNPDGTKHQTFINGTIYWTPATGPYVG